MKTQTLKSNLLLILTAAIWGFAFVAQRLGMNHIGPFTFNGIRFALGSLSLLPLLLYFGKQRKAEMRHENAWKYDLRAGLLLGLVLFTAASLQQIGLIYTTAGKAAFITGLYMVIVPILGIFMKQYIRLNAWIGALIALAGLFLLCITDRLSIARGDLLELIGSFLWAVHILLIDHFTKKVDALKLSFLQFAACAVLSLGTAVFTETITLDGIMKAAVPILYGGICSVGVAYTLQVVAQKNAEPTQAAIILSMETVFAAVGGWLILRENLGLRGIAGCTLMFIGMLLPQIKIPGKKEVRSLHTEI